MKIAICDTEAIYPLLCLVRGLNRVNAGFDAVKDRNEVDIVRGLENFQLDLTFPEKTTVTVSILLAELGLQTIQVPGKSLSQKGKAGGRIEGITPVGEDAGYI